MATRPGPVLVTGANSGIGLVTAVHLANRGWDVYGTVRSRAKAGPLREAARDAGVESRVHPVVLDVSDHAAVRQRWPRLPDFFGVVNNAGGNVTGPLEEVDEADAKALLDINLVTPAVVASCALPAMREAGAGRIVNVSSIAGTEAILPFNSWYHASKFGLEALSDVLRVEVATFGVKVVLIQPGFVSTGILGKASHEMGGADAESPYAAGVRRAQQVTDFIDRVAPSSQSVASAIASALESRRPKRRYRVGRDAQVLRGLGLVPSEVTDRVVRIAGNLD